MQKRNLVTLGHPLYKAVVVEIIRWNDTLKKRSPAVGTYCSVHDFSDYIVSN